MNAFLTITKSLHKKAEKLDKFTNTYLRCFDPTDTKKVLYRNNIGKFVNSLIAGPVPLVFSLSFPYDIIYLEFFELPYIYSLPGYCITFFISRELLGNISFRYHLRFKQKLYDKYHPQMDLTKDDIEEIEYQEEKLKLTSSEKNPKNESEQKQG